MRRVIAFFIVIALAGLFLAACGSDGSASTTPEGKRYVAALMASYRASKAKQSLTESEARCLVERAVDTATVSAITRAGLTPKDLDHGSAFQAIGTKLTPARAKQVARALAEAQCLNPGLAVYRGVKGTPAVRAIPDAKLRCIFVTLGEPAAADRAFADSLLGLPAGDREFRDTFQRRGPAVNAAKRCKVDPKLLG